MTLKAFLKKILSVPSPNWNRAAAGNIKKLNQSLGSFPHPLILNLGSGNRFIGKDKLDLNKVKIVQLDMGCFSSVDVIGDAHGLPFSDHVFSAIVCQAVLEHVRNPQKVIDEMFRVLRADGLVYAEIPFMQGFHPDPEDFHRFTLQGIESLFSRFFILDKGICVGPSSAVSGLLREYIAGIFTGFSHRKILGKAVYFAVGWLTFPIKYLDLFLFKNKNAHKIASGLYVLGKKIGN
jgi:SAM-dependent methyltransferase